MCPRNVEEVSISNDSEDKLKEHLLLPQEALQDNLLNTKCCHIPFSVAAILFSVHLS